MILVGPRWGAGGSVGLASSGIDALSPAVLRLGSRIAALATRICRPARLTAQFMDGAERDSMIGDTAAFGGNLILPRT